MTRSQAFSRNLPQSQTLVILDLNLTLPAPAHREKGQEMWQSACPKCLADESLPTQSDSRRRFPLSPPGIISTWDELEAVSRVTHAKLTRKDLEDTQEAWLKRALGQMDVFFSREKQCKPLYPAPEFKPRVIASVDMLSDSALKPSNLMTHRSH